MPSLFLARNSLTACLFVVEGEYFLVRIKSPSVPKKQFPGNIDKDLAGESLGSGLTRDGSYDPEYSYLLSVEGQFYPHLPTCQLFSYLSYIEMFFRKC